MLSQRGFMIRMAAVFWTLALLAGPAQAETETLRVYIDADFTTSYEVGGAIALGVRTALREVDFTVAGASIQIIDKNHKGSAKRSFRNLQGFLNDTQALAVFGGMHSPPYLEHKDFMNDAGLLTLLPWSAAGPITRASAGTENWIFRLSVDDSKAGRFLVDQAIETQGCKRIALLLIDTGWGRVNKDTMLRVLAEKGQVPAYVSVFPETIGESSAKVIVSKVRKADADCAIMLAQATEAAYLSQAFYEQDHPITLLSHWAILGAKYPQTVSDEVRQFIRLQVLQSCGLRVENDGSDALDQALSSVGYEVESLSDIPAPAGFVHGYDLARVFIAAAEQAAKTDGWGKDIADKRAALKTALENLQDPVVGILKTYERPFSAYGPQSLDAHEALGAQDLCMAEYSADGRLHHVRAK
jgi:branched-chain amino acid transport system substrate-binding protein